MKKFKEILEEAIKSEEGELVYLKQKDVVSMGIDGISETFGRIIYCSGRLELLNSLNRQLTLRFGNFKTIEQDKFLDFLSTVTNSIQSEQDTNNSMDLNEMDDVDILAWQKFTYSSQKELKLVKNISKKFDEYISKEWILDVKAGDLMETDYPDLTIRDILKEMVQK